MVNGTASDEKVASYNSDILNYIALDLNVSANLITPKVIADDDSAVTLEDNTVEINILINDAFVANAPFSVDVTSGANGTTSKDNNVVTYTPDQDFNGTDSFSYTIVQGDKSATAVVSITIEAVNDAPTIGNTIFSIDENKTAVATISVSDVDKEDTLVLTMVSESTDAGSFSLSDQRELSFKVAPDYEVSSTTYSLTVSVTDGIEVVEKAVTVEVTDVDEPPVFSSSGPYSAQENQQEIIGTFSASDPENKALTYSLGGNDAASLTLSSAGVISFAVAPNYEIKNTYSAAINAYDGLNTTVQAIVVEVSDINDAPVATAGSYDLNLMPQSQTSKTVTLAGTDEDGDALTYALVSTGSYG